MANLFIIGTGFDLAHNVKSTYMDFKHFLEDYYYATGKQIEVPYVYSSKLECSNLDAANLLVRLISKAEIHGEKWSDLENSLGRLDYSIFFDDKYDDYYTDYVLRSLELAIPKINSFFAQWIKQLNVGAIKQIDSFQKMINPKEDIFITFNYTDLLENKYSCKNVCHVHGDAHHNVLMGHGDNSYIRFSSRNTSFKGNMKAYTLKKDRTKIPQSCLTYDDYSIILHCLKQKTNKTNSLKYQLNKKLYFLIGEDKFWSHSISENNKNKWKIDYAPPYLKSSYYRKALKEDSLNEKEIRINRIHNLLRKDIGTELNYFTSFINGLEINDRINNVYSIGFSYAKVDLKVVQLIILLEPENWYINNYDKNAVLQYISSISKLGYSKRIGTFDL